MINWNRRKYTKEQFVDAWNNSLSIAQVANKLNCNKNGGGYFTLRNTAEDLGLTRDHMTGQAWNQGDNYRSFNPVKPLHELLVNGSKAGSYHLKLRLYKENLLNKQCSQCGIIEWQGKEAPLALDHINGNKRDNRIENLRILCYNCHGQTNTFGRKVRNEAGY